MPGFRVWGLRLFRGIIFGLSRENGKEHGNYCLGLKIWGWYGIREDII